MYDVYMPVSRSSTEPDACASIAFEGARRLFGVMLVDVDAGGSEGRWKLKSPSLRLDRVQSTVENSDGGSTASRLG